MLYNLSSNKMLKQFVNKDKLSHQVFLELIYLSLTCIASQYLSIQKMIISIKYYYRVPYMGVITITADSNKSESLDWLFRYNQMFHGGTNKTKQKVTHLSRRKQVKRSHFVCSWFSALSLCPGNFFRMVNTDHNPERRL